MTQDEIKAVLDRVLTWPRERQEEAIAVLTAIESGDDSLWQLSDAQAAEVRRRLADPNRKTIPFEQAFQRFRRRGA